MFKFSVVFARLNTPLLAHLNPLALRCVSTVLGIETSCDDTGAAVVTSKKVILGESLASQTATSIKYLLAYYMSVNLVNTPQLLGWVAWFLQLPKSYMWKILM